MRVRVRTLALPMCGVSTRFGRRSSGLAAWQRLALEYVERRAGQLAASRAPRRAPPRPRCRRAPRSRARPRAACARAPRRRASPRVSGVSATWTLTKSEPASSSGSVTHSSPSIATWRAVPAEHAHAERACALRHRLADRAESDDAERRAGQIAAEQQLGRPLAPAPLAHQAVGFHDATRRGKQQCESELRRGVCQDAGRVTHRDAAGGRRHEIHVVEAHRAARNRRAAEERAEQLGVDRVGEQAEQAVRPRDRSAQRRAAAAHRAPARPRDRTPPAAARGRSPGSVRVTNTRGFAVVSGTAGSFRPHSHEAAEDGASRRRGVV